MSSSANSYYNRRGTEFFFQESCIDQSCCWCCADGVRTMTGCFKPLYHSSLGLGDHEDAQELSIVNLIKSFSRNARLTSNSCCCTVRSDGCHRTRSSPAYVISTQLYASLQGKDVHVFHLYMSSNRHSLFSFAACCCIFKHTWRERPRRIWGV